MNVNIFPVVAWQAGRN